MKNTLCLLLAALIFTLAGCGSSDGDSVSFCYLRGEFTYGAEDSVIVSEQREISSRSEDLNYLLNLYLAGPLEDAYRSPFPKGTRLQEISRDADTLHLWISEEFASLETVRMSLAGACLASTCFQLTDAAAVHIYSGEPGSKPLIALTRESFTLLDSLTPNSEPIPSE